jgi:hypothetical protein
LALALPVTLCNLGKVHNIRAEREGNIGAAVSGQGCPSCNLRHY